MKVDIRLDTKELEKALNRTKDEIQKQIPVALMKTAQFGTQVILDRTEKGKGINGPFKPYSPFYAKAKNKGWPRTMSRPSFGGDASGIVNLMVTGKMLSSIQQKLDGQSSVKIYFARATEAKKAAFNDQRRPFFGFNVSEKQRLQTFFGKAFK